MIEPVVISVPYPPSANRLWRAVKGRNVKSADYRAWMDHAFLVVRGQRPRAIVGAYHLTITATRPDKRRRDLGNLEKPISDCLVQAGVVDDDCEARRITLEWAEGVRPGGHVVVTVSEAA